MIDLRSDTVVKPTQEMREFMMQAEVGDDVFQEDPSINKLEAKCAEIFGMEAALFCPSGTMTNQIGVNVLTNPYEEVICYKDAHIYKYEGGGVAGNSGLSFKLLDGDRGILNIEDIKSCINPDDIHFPKTSLIALENTVNKGGGKCYSLDHIRSISELAGAHGLNMHLDGARLYNAIVKNNEEPKEYGKYFDTISLCLSKGLGAPVGSVLIANKKIINNARRIRKRYGGGMRQGGFLAAAGIYALDNNVNRLADDHKRAEDLSNILQGLNYVSAVQSVETNIVICSIEQDESHFLEKLKQKGVLGVPFGKNEVRFVTHLEIDDSDIDETEQILKSLDK